MSRDGHKDIEKRRFHIGEISEMLGVSRDTLRIYEEKGLIVPKRDENGYRTYSENDIYYLIGVRFYRDNSIPSVNVMELITADKAEDMLSIINARIEAEEKEMLRHKQNMALAYYRQYWAAIPPIPL